MTMDTVAANDDRNQGVSSRDAFGSPNLQIMPHLDQLQNFAVRSSDFQAPAQWTLAPAPSSTGALSIPCSLPDQVSFASQRDLAEMLNGNGPVGIRDGNTVTLIVGETAQDSRAASSNSESINSDK